MSPRPGKGRGVDATGRSIKDERHLRLPHWMMNSLAWRALQPVERAAFIEIAARYAGPHTNGKIPMGVRELAGLLNVKAETAGWAISYLTAFGFLRIRRNSSFDLKDRSAREFQVTLFPDGDQRATVDFMRWTGKRPGRAELRPEKRKSQSRLGIPTVPLRGTVRNNLPSDSAVLGHREAPNRAAHSTDLEHPSISHASPNDTGTPSAIPDLIEWTRSAFGAAAAAGLEFQFSRLRRDLERSLSTGDAGKVLVAAARAARSADQPPASFVVDYVRNQQIQFEKGAAS